MTITMESPIEPRLGTGRQVAREVDRLVGAALRLQLDPSLTTSERLVELTALARSDSELLGRAWLHVAIEHLRSPSKGSAAAANLLSTALDLQDVLASVA